MDPGFQIDPPNIIGRPHGFAFAAELPLGAPATGSRDAEISLTVDRKHDFILRWTPCLHATRLAGAPVIHAATLLRGVARVDFAYWQRTPTGGTWLSSWDGRVPPPLVRIRIVFINHGKRADRRHWPSIVVAPRRQPSF